MTDTVIHLDADKGHDVVYYQRVVIGNFIRLLKEGVANFVDLAARHDAWTARLEAEAQRPPKDENEPLQRVQDFLSWRDSFHEALRALDHYGHGTSVMAGRRLPRSDSASPPEAPKPPLPPRPSMPEWVDDNDGGISDIHGNFRIELTRCATAHLVYFIVYKRFGDEWGCVAELATLDSALNWADGMVTGGRRWVGRQP